MKEEEKEELQEKYIEMKIIEEQIQQLQKQAQTVEQQLIELITTIQSLEDFKKTSPGDKVLVPISPGVFAKAELKNNKEFLVNVGSDTIVKKDIESTKKLIEKQIEEIRSLNMRINVQIQRLALQASNVEKELRELASK